MHKDKSYKCFYCHSVKIQPGRRCQTCGARTLVAATKNNRRSKAKENYEEKYNNWRDYMEFLNNDSLIE